MVEIKGLSVRDTLHALRERLGPGLERFLATASPEARGLFAEPVNVSGWYPLDAYADLLEAEVRADGGDPSGLVSRAERVLEQQLSGVYRVFIRLGSAEALVKRISGAHETYFRGTQVAVLACQKGAAAVRYTGFTERHRVMEHVIQAFYRKGLQLAGAKDVQVRLKTSLAQKTGLCEVEMTWR
jgi:hypothetical protein